MATLTPLNSSSPSIGTVYESARYHTRCTVRKTGLAARFAEHIRFLKRDEPHYIADKHRAGSRPRTSLWKSTTTPRQSAGAGANRKIIPTVRHQTSLQFIVSEDLPGIFPIYWLRATHSLGGPTQGVSGNNVRVGSGLTVYWPF